MSTEERPAKRARSSEPESSQALRVIKGEPYFPDGNVVLQSCATDNVAAQYRVHKSVLTKHSAIFEDIFSIPQPVDQELVDGCPVVNLTENEEELKIVLDALYGSYINKPVLPLSAIQAMLRLGKKYFLADLRREAIRRLRNDFGSDLESWNLSKSFLTIDGKGAAHLVDIAALAYEEGIHVVLPHVLTKCLELYGFNLIIHGAKVKDDDKLHTLPVKLQLLCSQAYFKMLKSQPQFIDWLPEERVELADQADPDLPDPECDREEECEKGLARIRWDVCGLLQSKLVALDEWDGYWDEILCGHCAESAKLNLNFNRRNFWRQLPLFYGFKSWESLKKDCEIMLE